MSKINWRYFKDVEGLTTNSLWLTSIHKDDGKFILPKRDMFKDFDRSFHGLFIPEIPYQFILRFAREHGWIWDCFAGNATTLYVAKKLNCLSRLVCNDIKSRSTQSIVQEDSVTFNPTLYSNGELFSLVFCHPPYFNIIKFTEEKEDLSNFSILEDFLAKMEKIIENIYSYVKIGGYVILVCGNIWYACEEIDLGVIVKELFRKKGFKCKSHIIKDYGETKGRGNTYNLQYFRNLKNNTNFFYGDNIFILRKEV